MLLSLLLPLYHWGPKGVGSVTVILYLCRSLRGNVKPDLFAFTAFLKTIQNTLWTRLFALVKRLMANCPCASQRAYLLCQTHTFHIYLCDIFKKNKKQNLDKWLDGSPLFFKRFLLSQLNLDCRCSPFLLKGIWLARSFSDRLYMIQWGGVKDRFIHKTTSAQLPSSVTSDRLVHSYTLNILILLQWCLKIIDYFTIIVKIPLTAD